MRSFIKLQEVGYQARDDANCPALSSIHLDSLKLLQVQPKQA